jgi:DNA repair ATPase RecN
LHTVYKLITSVTSKHIQKYIDDKKSDAQRIERVLQRMERIQRSLADFKRNSTKMYKQKEKVVYGMD